MSHPRSSAPGTPNAKRMIIIRWPMNLEQARFNMVEQQIRPGRCSTRTFSTSCTSCRASSSCPRPSHARLLRSGNSHRRERMWTPNSRRACSRRSVAHRPRARGRHRQRLSHGASFASRLACVLGRNQLLSPSSAAPTSSAPRRHVTLEIEDARGWPSLLRLRRHRAHRLDPDPAARLRSSRRRAGAFSRWSESRP